MGYTHYWEYQKNFSQKDWELGKRAVRDIVSYCEEMDIPLVQESDWDMYPLIDNDSIRFNGKLADGHETFFLHRQKPEVETWMLTKNPFAFCKTARKPYDLGVCLTLLAFYMIAPEVLIISSDGEWEGDWDDARKHYFELFGEEPVCPFPFTEPQEDEVSFHHHVSKKPNL